MGWIVDNTSTRWGKFRPWIFIGTLINSIVILLLFWNPAGHFSDFGVMAWCAIFYILWGMTFTILDIPFWSQVTGFPRGDREIMSAIPRLGAMIGYNGTLIIGLPLITYFGVGMGGTESDGYFRFAIFVVICFILSEMICVANVKQHVSVPKAEKISFKKIFTLLAGNDQLLVIIVLTILQQIAQNLVNGSILYYFKYIIRDKDLYPFFMGFGAVMQFVGFLLFPFLVQKTSRKTVYVLSGTCMMLGYLGLFFYGDSPESNEYLVSFLYGFASFGLALSIVSTTVMLADTVEYGEYKLGVLSLSFSQCKPWPLSLVLQWLDS